MSLSLREQLLQAGLGTKKQAKQAEQAERKSKHENRQKSKPPSQPSAVAQAAQQAQAAKLARDQELNRRQQEKAQKKARRAQIRQLVEQHKLPRPDSDDYYNFVDGTTIRRIGVEPPLREQLMSGAVGIVRCAGRYELVPADLLVRIREIDAQVIAHHNIASQQTVDENDPYKDFVVPDDLTW